MAKKLDDFKVVLGQMIMVENQNKKALQKENYIAIQIQDQDGENERCLLFTEIELSDATKIISDFLNEKMVAGRLYNFVIGKQNLYLIKLINRFGETKICRFSKKKLQIAENRAKKNPQDLTKKYWITDISD